MNPPSPATPFESPSWEPRFAVEGHGRYAAVLGLALQMHCWCLRIAPNDETRYRGYVVGPGRIVVSVDGQTFPGPLEHESLFAAADEATGVDAIAAWLRERAGYGPRPWFDGGESRGFKAWHVAYTDPSGPLGYMVVEPKWLEIHK